MLRHDADIAVDFLRWLHPKGPWCLTVINPATREDKTPTFTFYPQDESRFRTWLAEWASWNVYYHVNKPTHDLSKKAERKDIDQIVFLHVDVDPRASEDFGNEQKRILKLFETDLPPGVPRPSAVVYSGGGYNALWRLAEPLPVGGDLAKAEDLKRYNLQLEILFGGDHCHNVDRILRLPGSVNWPNEKKRKKGRVPAQSAIVWREDTTYPISGFVAARPVQQAEAGLAAGGGVTVAISGNVPKINHVSDLGENVSPRTKMLIVQGHDPDDPGKWDSRSELLHHVCCELVRAGVSDDMIFATITDPGFMISASVLDKGSSTERYAIRQIQRAREEVIDPQLRSLNEKHAIIGNTGGRCRVIEEVHDYALDRPRLTFQSFEDFRNRYMHLRVQAGTDKENQPKFVPLGQWWLQHTNRRQYETIVFSPGRETTSAYNLWRGFSCEAKPGDKHKLFLDHVLINVCDGNRAHYDYLVRWLARGVQKPDCAGEVAVVFRGDQGVGKGTVANEYGALWGRHFIQISDPKHLVGNFNAHLRDAVVVFADEAFYAGDKKHESILKTLITEQLLVIEGKGRDVETSRNFVHLMMASNNTWVVPAGMNERRYFVLDVKPYRMGDAEYWTRLRDSMAEGGRENLLHFLLTLDLAGFNVREVPKTDALRDQKMLSMTPEQEWLYQKLQNGRWLRGHTSWEGPVFKDDLLDDWLRHAAKINVQGRRSNATVLGKFLVSSMPESWPRSKQHVKQYESPEGHRMQERLYAWEFPPLADCRAHWDRTMLGGSDWQDPEDASQVEAF